MDGRNQDTLVGLAYLMSLLGVGRTTLWRMQRMGLLPKPLRFGSNRPKWRKSDLDTWFAGLEGGGNE